MSVPLASGARRLVLAVIGAVLATACFGRTEPSNATASGDLSSDAPSGSDGSECKNAGGACLTFNPPGSKGQGPANCGELGTFVYGKAYVPSPLACNVGTCCVPPKAPVACLDVPREAPTCGGAAAADPVTFGSRTEVEDFLRGTWLTCAFDYFPGSYSDLEGMAFDGAGDAFAAHAVTWSQSSSTCSIINDDRYHRPTQLDLVPASPGSNDWLVSVTMPSTGTQTIASLSLATRRLRFASGVELVHVGDTR